MENKELAPQFIKEDALIKIEINAPVMRIIKDLLAKLIDEMGNENFMIFTKQIMDEARGPQNELEYKVYYLSVFLGICERAAYEQGLVRDMTEEEQKNWNDSKASIQELKDQVNES